MDKIEPVTPKPKTTQGYRCDLPDGRTIHIPYVECEDCGEPIHLEPEFDERGNLYFRSYECSGSQRKRWELEERLYKEISKKDPTRKNEMRGAYMDDCGFGDKDGGNKHKRVRIYSSGCPYNERIEFGKTSEDPW